MEMRSSKVSESCGDIELIRMIRMEPRRKPRMEIIKLAMKLRFRKILQFGWSGAKNKFLEIV